MRKETHCVYRYRIWHPKHESTFGLGAPGQGRAVGHQPPCSESCGQLVSSARSQTSEVGRLISANSLFPDPALSHFVAQTGGEFTVARKRLAFTAATGRKLLLTPIHRNQFSSSHIFRQICCPDTQKCWGKNGLGIPLYFPPYLLLEPGFDSCFCCWVLLFYKSKISAEENDPVKVKSKYGFF